MLQRALELVFGEIHNELVLFESTMGAHLKWRGGLGVLDQFHVSERLVARVHFVADVGVEVFDLTLLEVDEELQHVVAALLVVESVHPPGLVAAVLGSVGFALDNVVLGEELFENQAVAGGVSPDESHVVDQAGVKGVAQLNFHRVL